MIQDFKNVTIILAVRALERGFISLFHEGGVMNKDKKKALPNADIHAGLIRRSQHHLKRLAYRTDDWEK